MNAPRTIDYSKYPLPRSRHHVGANLYIPAQQIKVELDYYPPLYESLHAVNWAEHFTNGLPPRLLDIGCGLGKFMLGTSLALATASQQGESTTDSKPLANILGLEVRKYAVDWICNVITNEQLPNAACLWYNVANSMKFIADDSIDTIFYFFPDPWFKRRHVQRRAFTTVFLDECARVLQPSGTLYLMTDVQEVDQYQQRTLTKHGKFSFQYATTDAEWGLHVKTNHEEFCDRRGIPYIRMKCKLR